MSSASKGAGYGAERQRLLLVQLFQSVSFSRRSPKAFALHEDLKRNS